MSALYDALRRISRDLEQLQVPWALVGGMALAVRAEARTTRDVDCAISAATEKEAEALVLALRNLGYRDLPDETIMEGAVTGSLRGVRLLVPGQSTEGIVVDLLHRMCSIEPEIVAAAEVIEILPDLVVPVATRSHLIAMKVVSWRTKDQEDIRMLLREATDGDIRGALEALQRIEEKPSPDHELEPGESLMGRFRRLLSQ